MTVTLRQITTRAGGGEIARTSTLTGDTLTIGRGTDCDIQVADLAIMQRHARLICEPGGGLVLQEIGGVPLRVDGHFTARVEFDVRDGATLALGSHALTVAAGPAPGDIVITVERIAAPYDSRESTEEAHVFGIARVMPGKRVLVWSLIALVLGFYLVLPLFSHLERRPSPPDAVQSTAFHADELWSSGPLSRAHANLSHNCGACHVDGFVSVRDASCRACHSALPDHAPLTRMQQARPPAAGLFQRAHVRLDRATHLIVGRCAACHKEHEGPDGALLVASSFCGDCHKGLQARLPDSGLLNAVDFSRPGGHPQFRPTLVVAAAMPLPRLARLSLDDRPQEHSGLKFPHRLHLDPGGAPARLAAAMGRATGCASCHVPDTDGVRFRAVEMERDCAACHDLAFDRDRAGVVRTLPHGKPAQVIGILRDFYALQPGWRGFGDRRVPGLVSPVGAARGLEAKVRAVYSPGGACFGCHAVIAPARGLNFRVVPVDISDHYLLKGRFPHGRHKATPCAECHAAATSESSADVLLPGIATCRQCHNDAHARTSAPASCQTCHAYHAEPARPQFGQNLPPLPPGPGSHGTPRLSDRTTGRSVNTGS